MPATFTIPLITVIPGQTITASLWNNEYGNIYDNFVPSGMDDYSANDAQMQTATDPFPSSATSRATSLQGEIERLRFQLANITGKTYWYNDPDVSIATFKTRYDTHGHTGAGNDGPQLGDGSLANGVVKTITIADANVTTAKIADANVTDAKISAVATSKLTGTISTSQIASSAVDENKIATSVAGNGLAGGAGTALSVNVDASTIEINSDTLRVKDAGITQAKLATAVVNQLGQNIGLTTIVSSATNGTLVNYSGQGRLVMIGAEGGTMNAGTATIDGVAISIPTLTAAQIMVWTGQSPYVAAAAGGGGITPASFLFKTSLVVAKSGGAGNLVVIYERAA